MQQKIVIFGGMGFIGQHLVRRLVDSSQSTEIVLADLDAAERDFLFEDLSDLNCIKRISLDVRKYSEEWSTLPQSGVETIYNFAAVHREPGHLHSEYFETNLKGARNVCRYAEDVGCLKIIFTSSIAVYGADGLPCSEDTLPQPRSAYGASKLVAEEIHKAWAMENIKKSLTIVRPGVVYGKGENGNVTRLVRLVSKGFVPYFGNRTVVKSGCYVKNLICSILEVSERVNHQILIYNMSFDPMPELQHYVKTISEVTEKRVISLSVPRFFALLCSKFFDLIALILKISTPINSVRYKKLVLANHIIPQYLRSLNWIPPFTFKESFLDWKQEDPDLWN